MHPTASFGRPKFGGLTKINLNGLVRNDRISTDGADAVMKTIVAAIGGKGNQTVQGQDVFVAHPGRGFNYHLAIAGGPGPLKAGEQEIVELARMALEEADIDPDAPLDPKGHISHASETILHSLTDGVAGTYTQDPKASYVEIAERSLTDGITVTRSGEISHGGSITGLAKEAAGKPGEDE